MTEYRSEGSPASSRAHDGLSVPFLVLAAILIGVGLAGMAYFLVTFQWIYFASVILVVTGGLMLFTPRAGPDRA